MPPTTTRLLNLHTSHHAKPPMGFPPPIGFGKRKVVTNSIPKRPEAYTPAVICILQHSHQSRRSVTHTNRTSGWSGVHFPPTATALGLTGFLLNPRSIFTPPASRSTRAGTNPPRQKRKNPTSHPGPQPHTAPDGDPTAHTEAQTRSPPAVKATNQKPD